MTQGPTIPDIARLAGVSTATVDRVLNRRTSVRARTADRVLSAATELGYLSGGEVQDLSGPQPVKVTLLLPRGTNPYLVSLNDTARAFVEGNQRDARMRSFFIDGFDPGALSQALRQLSGSSDAVIFMAIDHPKVRAATEALVSAGKRVVTLISDVTTSGRHAYVGIDNFAAGRTAALLIGRLTRPQQGRVALIAASRVYRAHSEREVGFLGYLAERHPGLEISATREGHDDRDENYRLTRRLLDRHPDLVGIYNVGGSSDGIGRALRESGREDQITFIGHGLTPDTRAMLIDETMDAVISQNPQRMIETALQAALGRDISPVPMELYFSENLPAS